MRNLTCGLFMAIIVVCASMSGCGGGGGGSSDATSAAAPAPASAAPAASAPVAVDPSQPAAPSSPPANTVAQSATPNVQPISVTKIATGTRNMLQTRWTRDPRDCASLENWRYALLDKGRLFYLFATHILTPLIRSQQLFELNPPFLATLFHRSAAQFLI